VDVVMSGSSQLLAPRRRRALHRVRRAGYRLLPGPRELPTYFIVGAKRAGTTSLDEYIKAHPLVLRGLVEKGCRYYDVNYDRGPEWFRNQLLPVSEIDRLERKLGQRPILGESSPYYAFHPESAKRIAADVPDARLIFVLRDPVQRTWSHHRYETARGFETLDFAAAIAAEPDRLADPDPATRDRNHRHFSYIARSRYAEQLDRLRESFDPEQILVIESEQLFADPGSTMEVVFAHLSLDPVPMESYATFKGQAASAVPAEAAAKIREAVADDVARLEGLLGRPPSWVG
jgi:hypothetical protein